MAFDQADNLWQAVLTANTSQHNQDFFLYLILSIFGSIFCMCMIIPDCTQVQNETALHLQQMNRGIKYLGIVLFLFFFC